MKAYVSYKQMADLASKRIEFLEEVYNKLDKHDYKVEGRVEISSGGNEKGKFIWAHDVVENGVVRTKREYIPKRNKAFASKIAQKKYDDVVKLAILAEMKVLQKESAMTKTLESVYSQMSDIRKQIVDPGYVTDDRFVQDWISEPYVGLSFDKFESKSLETKNGIRVRSKSEILIGNSLFDNGIPFKYECPLRLRHGTKYPDFTVLNKRTRRVYYWEHFGMMDDDTYVQNSMDKLRFYESEGMVLGKDLIATFETSNNPISIAGINGIIRSFLI